MYNILCKDTQSCFGIFETLNGWWIPFLHLPLHSLKIKHNQTQNPKTLRFKFKNKVILKAGNISCNTLQIQTFIKSSSFTFLKGFFFHHCPGSIPWRKAIASHVTSLVASKTNTSKMPRSPRGACTCCICWGRMKKLRTHTHQSYLMVPMPH